VAWQALLSDVAGVPLRLEHRVVLAATVWLAYVLDRWIEGWRLHWRDIRTQRHHFYQRHRWPVAIVWAVVALADIALALSALPARDLLAGALLLVPVLLYLLSHQLVHRHRRWRAPKELIVAALVTCGAAIFVTATAQPGAVLSSASLIGLVCFTNCALISAWEREVDESHGQTSLAIDAAEHHWVFSQLPWLVAVIAALACVETTADARVVAACERCAMRARCSMSPNARYSSRR
jgi:hypothetical protein